jgi:(1->4)-alpha-D-glucan 1-alpha-D-glucosylmutase
MSESIDYWARSVAEEVLRGLPLDMAWPDATYRLQFNKECTFREAAGVAPYLADLGVSHIYASPYLAARPGSMHGYDICDHGRLNPEVGTVEEHAELVARLRSLGMGQVLDVVPNHMSVSCGENHWWNDVLENGPASAHAQYFDIDWHPVKEELDGKVLLPILGEQYGEELESGRIRVCYEDGAFFIVYYERRLPLAPKTAIPLLRERLEELATALGAESEEFGEYQSIITSLEHLPDRDETSAEKIAVRQREKEVVKRRLHRLASECSAVMAHVQRVVSDINGEPGKPETFDRLDALLGAQVYRMAHWKSASDEINYRRFFDINDLGALCMEHLDVFEDTHKLVLDLLVQGSAHGLRIDHIDGLYNPTEYLWRLQEAYLREMGKAALNRLQAADESGAAAPAWEDIQAACLDAVTDRLGIPRLGALAEDTAWLAPRRAGQGFPLYVLVEKILGPDEPLPDEWPTAGSTGYEFMNLLNGLFLEPAGLAAIERFYARFTGDRSDFPETAYRSKHLILRVAMSSELQMLAHRLNRISEQHRRSRDFTLNMLRIALREILACFPVYRTYPGPRGISERDRRFILQAVAQARRRNPAIDGALFDFIRGILLLEHPPGLTDEDRQEREVFEGRFQQVTSPLMAKGIEDTAFYVSCPLASINEVGGDPRTAITSVESFHRDNAARRAARPASMLATSTHDTKRSEDVRARLNVLSEMPRAWQSAVNRWARLAGIWPLEPPTAAEHQQLIERLGTYMQKAAHEAKQRTSWISPNPAYDDALWQFVAGTLEHRPDNRFLSAFVAWHPPIATWGLYTSLAQTVLKLTSPGVPDIYQGQEFWDFSLVDPDNRRPVDYVRRRELLADLRGKTRGGDAALLETARRLCVAPRGDRTKLFVTWRTLQFRRQARELLRQGTYLSLPVVGERADHVCAFAWHLSHPRSGPRSAIIVAPRLVATLTPAEGALPRAPIGEAIWGDTTIATDDRLPAELRDIFTGQVRAVGSGGWRLADALADFPVAVLTSEA